MSIGNRILLGFAALTIVLIIFGVYALSQIREIRDTTQAIVARDLAFYRDLELIEDNQRLMREVREGAVTRFYLGLLGEPQQGGQDPVGAWRQQATLAETALVEAIADANTYQASALSPERAAAWRDVAALLNEAMAALGEVRARSEAQFSALAANDLKGVLAEEQAIAASRATFDQRIAQAIGVLATAVGAGLLQVGQIYDESRIATLVGVGLAVLLSFLVTFLIRASILTPLRAFVSFVERVGRGELVGEPAAAGRDELGRLGATLNRMVDGLRELARQSREATANLTAVAAEIRASTQEQAAGVEEQLAAVQETAATVDQITHAGAQIGRRAQEVIASAQATAQTSAAGLKAVVETTLAMDAIRSQAEAVAENIVALSENTQAIGEVVSTVNDISERSHLLALNAAIEAAVAGESGRGFAVVAQEMKALADQAKDATAQVRSILGEIQRGINSSVMLTEEAVKGAATGKERTDTTRQTIQEMTGRIQESVQTFQQIVASTNQQQLGVEQVTGALQNIRQASQQTAAGTRQLDGAAGNLAQLSQQLLALAERYRL